MVKMLDSADQKALALNDKWTCYVGYVYLDQANNWLRKNCKNGTYRIGGLLVFFMYEEDAILFEMSQ